MSLFKYRRSTVPSKERLHFNATWSPWSKESPWQKSMKKMHVTCAKICCEWNNKLTRRIHPTQLFCLPSLSDSYTSSVSLKEETSTKPVSLQFPTEDSDVPSQHGVYGESELKRRALLWQVGEQETDQHKCCAFLFLCNWGSTYPRTTKTVKSKYIHALGTILLYISSHPWCLKQFRDIYYQQVMHRDHKWVMSAE